MSELTKEKFQLPLKVKSSLLAICAISTLVSALGFYFDPERAWPNLLIAAYYFTTLGLSGFLFIAIQFVTKAGWSTVFRRVPETITTAIIPGALLMALVLLGVPNLYEWSHAETELFSHQVSGSGQWLNRPFFIFRTLVYFAIWIGLGRGLIKNSHLQDESGDIALSHKNLVRSAIFIILFALTVSVASFDWIMSLEHHWYSTIFGVYNFAGFFVNGMVTIVLLLFVLRKMGYFSDTVGPDHFHDLGKLIFGFSCFWAYIWFSQFMLIWYSNMPEETSYFMDRIQGVWGILMVLNLILNWGIPFLFLLPRPAKRRESYLVIICVTLLLGHWLDLYIMAMHPFYRHGIGFSLFDVSFFIMAVSGFALLFFYRLGKNNLIPQKDPTLEESLHFHQ
jgi:hypothetical protein